MKRLFFLCLLVAYFSVTVFGRSIRPVNNGDQLNSSVDWFYSGEKRYGLDVKYGGQKTTGNTLVLIAGNCFWDAGIRSYGEGPLANEHDKRFINHDYQYISNWTKPEQTIRWHIWCEKPGQVSVNIDLEVSKAQAGSTIEVSLGEEKALLKTVSNSKHGAFVQPWDITFDVSKKGKHTLTLKTVKVAGKDVGKLRRVELSGSAIKEASVLRARWRPGAVHGGLSSSTIKGSEMWAIQSRSAKGCTSYSPITTPFGYYGASFDELGRSSTSMNFSMWSYGRGTEEPAIEKLSHLIAVGSPEASFGGFGHEGTGVKPRGWGPLTTRPTTLTQALRVEKGDPYDIYYGYFIDPETNKWKFFAAGKKWHKPNRGCKGLSSPGSFVEVPGPADRQRSGDLRREGFIRGWTIDSDRKWHRFDQASQAKTENANKSWALIEGGWYSKAMGGMEHFDFNRETRHLTLSPEAMSEPLPEFLSKTNTADLYKLPAKFEVTAEKISSQKAKITINVEDAGTNATATIYYGTKEALTFSERWEKSQNAGSIGNGKTAVTITKLEPETDYYCRVLIINDQGKIWSMDTLEILSAD